MTRSEIPTLTTPRLRLEGHELEDFPYLTSMWGDPLVTKYIASGVPSTPRECWMRLLTYRGLWSILGYGYWAIRERASGRYVGDVGFADFHRTGIPSISGIPEAGWALCPWAQGKGYATEALRAGHAWLDRQSQHRQSCCIISPENEVSTHVARKVGFERVKAVVVGDRTLHVLHRHHG